MIEYISGKVIEATPAYAIIDCNGLGYEINITLIDYPKIKVGSMILLYIQEIIREDAHTLYGFVTKQSRELFRLLTGVSGVGPSTARLILSALEPLQLEQVIASGQDSALKAVKGIGGKTAQRIIVDLRDKIKTDESSLLTSGDIPVSEMFEDSLAALVMLGFPAQASRKVLKKIFADNPDISTEKAVKQALKML